jgi:lipopolysaccharide export LptBFGC system permease protein LptF
MRCQLVLVMLFSSCQRRAVHFQQHLQENATNSQANLRPEASHSSISFDQYKGPPRSSAVPTRAPAESVRSSLATINLNQAEAQQNGFGGQMEQQQQYAQPSLSAAMVGAAKRVCPIQESTAATNA